MLLNIFGLSEEQKHGIKILQELKDKISKIKFVEKKKKIELKWKDLNDKIKIFDKKQVKWITKDIEALKVEIEKFLEIQEDYSSIIEHVARKDIGSESEIVEVCDTSDKEIIFKYAQEKKVELIHEVLNTLDEKWISIEQIIKKIQGIVSERTDAEELRTKWNFILKDEFNKLNVLRNKCEILKNKISNSRFTEVGAINNEVSDLTIVLGLLEKYGGSYLSENALEALTNDVKDYMPRENVSYEDIYSGISDCIVINLKECVNNENDGTFIRDRMAKLIYDRLKKRMFVI